MDTNKEIVYDLEKAAANNNNNNNVNTSLAAFSKSMPISGGPESDDEYFESDNETRPNLFGEVQIQLRKDQKIKAMLATERKLWQEFYMYEYNKDPKKYLNEPFQQELKEFLQEKNGQEGRKSKYCYLTINIDNKLIEKGDVEDPQSKLNKQIRKSLKKKFITKKCYTFEQRGDSKETMGTGVHVNILIENGDKHRKPCKIREEFYNTFKMLLGDINKVCIRYADNPHNFLNYICGFKKSEVKQKLAKFDFIWRHKIGIEWVYEENWEPDAFDFPYTIDQVEDMANELEGKKKFVPESDDSQESDDSSESESD